MQILQYKNLDYLRVEPQYRKVVAMIENDDFYSADVKKISKEIGKEIIVSAVNDSKKYDPENKAKRAKPGKPSIYLE